MTPPEDRWLDQDAGPVVRPYALTRGRTRPAGESLDVIAMIIAVRGIAVDTGDLEPEHVAVLRLSAVPISVADLAADLDLPLGVIQILLDDLRERRLITVHHPIPPTRLPDPQILKEVVDGLRRL
jgi:Protein of unknown function (DUF742)